MSLIVVNGKRVENLGILKVYDNKNNREYNFVLSDNNVEYYEILRNQYGVNYVSYGKDFLNSNVKVSLRALKERLFMQFFTDELNKEYRFRSLSTVAELSDAVGKMQQVIFDEGIENIKTLFKVSPSVTDEESLIQDGKNLFNNLNTKRKAKMTKADIANKYPDIDFKDGNVVNPFTVSIPKKEMDAAKNVFDLDDITPTIIMDRINLVPRKEIVAETKKVEPSTELIGITPTPKKIEQVSNLIEETLDRKEMLKYQSDYLEAVKGNIDQKVDNVNTEKTVRVDSLDELLPQVEKKKEQVSSDFNKVLEKTSVKEEAKEETKEFNIPSKNIENTITSMEEFNNLSQVKDDIVPVTGKQKKLNKSAYVDTVILCLLVQLGIFGLLIFVLLLIK